MKKIIILLFILEGVALQTSAQVGIATVALGGYEVKSIIDKFEDASNRLIQNASTNASGLASKFGNELNVATQNASYYFDKNRKKTFEDLSIQEQNIFNQMNGIIDQFNKTRNTITTVSELTNLDLVAFTNNVPFLKSNIYYYISSINGCTITKSDADYFVTVRGLGFGFSDSKTHYETKVFLNNSELSKNLLDLTGRRELKIHLTSSDINKFFLGSKINYIPVTLVSNITKPTIFGFRSTTEHDTTKFNIVLMPIKAGYIVIQETVSEEALDYSKVINYSISKTFGPCDNKHECIMSEEWTCADNQRITGVRFEQTSGGPFIYRLRPPKPGEYAGPGSEYNPDFDILNDSKTAHVYRRLQQAGTPIYYIDYVQMKTSYKTITSNPLYFNYGESFEVTLDKKNEDCNYTIIGKLTTGQNININNSTVNSSQFLRFLGVRKVGENCKATFTVNID